MVHFSLLNFSGGAGGAIFIFSHKFIKTGTTALFSYNSLHALVQPAVGCILLVGAHLMMYPRSYTEAATEIVGVNVIAFECAFQPTFVTMHEKYHRPHGPPDERRCP